MFYSAEKYPHMDFKYPYIGHMEIKYIIAENVKRLMRSRDINIAQLGRKSGTSYGNAHRTVNPIEGAYNPSIKNLQAIADALKAPFWMLTLKEMPEELFDDKNAEEMVRLYAQCSQETRDKIFQQIKDSAELERLKKSQPNQ